MGKLLDNGNRSMIVMMLRRGQIGPLSVARWVELQRRIEDIESRRTK